MFKKLLIANRGEIACRIIKTAKRMGIQTVAVYSDADNNAKHIKLADQAIHIGPSPAGDSYLNQKNIINAIKISGADAVHPGYGFLSENSEFASRVEKLGICFVGPSAQAIKMMGDKIEAKKIAKEAGVNIVPGYMGVIKNEREAVKIANKIGYPIMLKAAAGGGGKGIRVVRTAEEMKQAFSSTTNEARNNFADARMFIEKFIENPRHIEIQIVGDKFGNYVCLGERECSIQRHHQKLIEEAPSPLLDERTRKKMYAQSVALAKKVKYFSAGTVEFIVDQKKNFFFMEMNTRLQVEHPVTELITGIDLVEQMINIAADEKLPFKQKDIKLNGWAFESRIYAEDPSAGFLPSTGRIDVYKEPLTGNGIRVDTGIFEGGEVSMFYDAMISKLCSYASTRDEAIDLMKHALGEFVIRGISHNISFLQAIFNSPRFCRGELATNFIQQEYQDGFSGAVLNDEQSAVILCSAVFIFLKDAKRAASTSQQTRGRERAIGTRWVVNLSGVNYPVTVRPIEGGYKITFENQRFYITSKWVLGSTLFPCTVNEVLYNVQVEYVTGGVDLTFMGSTIRASVFTPRAAELTKFVKISKVKEINPNLVSNIAGMIVDIKVKDGDKVVKGQPLVVIEAMKMENIFFAQVDGVVQKVHSQAGTAIGNGEMIIEIEPVYN